MPQADRYSLRKTLGLALGPRGAVLAILDLLDSAFLIGQDGDEDAGVALARAREKLSAAVDDPRLTLDRAVLVVPADCPATQTRNLRRLIETAGIEVVELLPAPEAETLGQTPGQPAELWAACGAARRGASQGLFYRVRLEGMPAGPEVLAVPELLGRSANQGWDLELHWAGPVQVSQTRYRLAGKVSGPAAAEFRHGGSLLVRNFASGLSEETFLDPSGDFAYELELPTQSDGVLHLGIRDNTGRERACVPACIRHRWEVRLGEGTPARLLDRPLCLEILDENRQRARQVVVPIGAALPGTFPCTLKTVDQSGKLVVPLVDGERALQPLVIDDLGPDLPVGSSVQLTFSLGEQNEVRAEVPGGRVVTMPLHEPPPPGPPGRAEIEDLREQFQSRLEDCDDRLRARFKGRFEQQLRELYEARHNEDDAALVDSFARLRELLHELEGERERALEPPWPVFEQFARQCERLAHEVGQLLEESPRGWMEQVQTCLRRAEAAWKRQEPGLYRECCGVLFRLRQRLEDMRGEVLGNKSDTDKLAELARRELERFRHNLAEFWKRARSRERHDLEAKFVEVARQGQGLSRQLRENPAAVLRLAGQLNRQLSHLQELVETNRPDESPPDGLLGE